MVDHFSRGPSLEYPDGCGVAAVDMDGDNNISTGQ